MGEIGTVDDHENIGRGVRRGGGGRRDQPQDLRKLRYYRGEPYDRQFLDTKQRRQPLAHHRLAADALEPHGAAEALAQHLHQAGAEPIPRFLRRDQEYFSRHIGGWSGRCHAGKPVTNRPAASAASIIACGSTVIVLPAMIAIPASFAAAAPSTVRGPMVGRSKRKSCPRLGAFPSTPRPAPPRMPPSPPHPPTPPTNPPV